MSRPCILSLALDLARQLYIKRRIQAVTLKSVNKLLKFSILIKLAILSTSRASLSMTIAVFFSSTLLSAVYIMALSDKGHASSPLDNHFGPCDHTSL